MSKTALITGSSSGIGYELAKVHAKQGGNLVLVALNKNKLDELKSDIEGKDKVKVYIIEKDLSLPGAVGEVYDELKQQKISVDYLINNAGFGDFGLFAESDWNKQEKMINLNIIALAHFTRLFLPDMIDKGSGKIMNVASTASFQPGPTMSVYFATKAFVLSFSEAVSNEVKDKGITVTALCPGSTETGFHAIVMGDSKLLKDRKKSSPSEVALYGYRAMMKGKTVAIHGFKNKIMATSVRFFPRDLVVKATRKIQEKKHIKKI
jgi:short-subunit dehydrogenase